QGLKLVSGCVRNVNLHSRQSLPLRRKNTGPVVARHESTARLAFAFIPACSAAVRCAAACAPAAETCGCGGCCHPFPICSGGCCGG
ncbi:unnamed protein product, partial [Sphacelaria rigidula]